MKSVRSKGFSLIEAMVASVLVAVGVSSVLHGYASLSRAQSQLQERDRMQRLAVSKYDELLATGITNVATSGDFQDYNETRYKWTLDSETTATTGLSTVQITVDAVDPNDTNQVQVNGLLYTAQTTATGTAGATG
jgi:prepilin-type N-terminal cleavage/methylation domain-containing protein